MRACFLYWGPSCSWTMRRLNCCSLFLFIFTTECNLRCCFLFFCFSSNSLLYLRFSPVMPHKLNSCCRTQSKLFIFVFRNDFCIPAVILNCNVWILRFLICVYESGWKENKMVSSGYFFLLFNSVWYCHHNKNKIIPWKFNWEIF